MAKFLCLHHDDNVLVACQNATKGAQVDIEGEIIVLDKDIPLAHKIARRPIKTGETVYKYGLPIGIATTDIAYGAHVHIHNIHSAYTATHALQDADGGLA